MDVTLESDVDAVSEWNVSGSICSKDDNTVHSPGNGKLFDHLSDRPMKTHVGSRTNDAASRNVGNSGIQCPICDRVLAKKAGHLKRHMLVHTGEKPYPCPLCARSFSTKHNMTRHLNTVHGGEVTKAESTLGSNMMLTSEHAFAEHTLAPHLSGDCWAGQAGGWTPPAVPAGHVAAVVDDRRAERCCLCCKVFRSRRALKRHMKVVHLDEKPICAGPFLQHETDDERIRRLTVPPLIAQENGIGNDVSEVTPPFTLEMLLSEDDSISGEKDGRNFKQDFDIFQTKERQHNGKLGPLCYENETSGESNILDLSLRAVEDPLKCDASDIQTQTVASDCQNMITMIERRPFECLTQIMNQSQSETSQLYCNQKDYFTNNILDLTLKTGKNIQPFRSEENQDLTLHKCDDTDQGSDCSQSTHCMTPKKDQIQGQFFDVSAAPKRTKTGESDMLTVKAGKGRDHHGSHPSGRNGRATVPPQAPPSSPRKPFYCLACCQAFVSGSALEDHVFERHS